MRKLLASFLFVWTAACFQQMDALLKFVNTLSPYEASTMRIINGSHDQTDYPYAPARYIVIYNKVVHK